MPATAFAVLCLLMLSLTPPPAHAQRAARVRGSVVDAVSGKAVAGAIVRVVGSSAARTSNADGEFELDIASVARYDLVAETTDGRIGVATNVLPGSSSDGITIRVSRDHLLGGDLLTAASLRPVSARLAPYAVDVVTSRDLPVPGSVNALASLEGKVSGLSVARANGLPGSDISLLLRSPVTLNPEAAPLVVVDGVFLSMLHERSLQDIDALDIDRIEVLKGAAAASLYGYQGMNGVIVIQTKRGRSNAIGRPQFSVRNEIGYDEADTFLPAPMAHPYRVNAAGQYVNAAGVVVPRSQRVRQANNIAENRYVDPTFDHDAQVFRRASFNTQTVSLSQNLSATNYALSYTRTRQQSTFVGADGIVRHTARLNLDHQWKQWLGINVSAARIQGSDAPTVANLGALLNYEADVDLRASDPTGKYPYDPFLDSYSHPTNPLVVQDRSQLAQDRQRTLLNVGLSSRPIAWLTLHASGSYDYGKQNFTDAMLTSESAGLRSERRSRSADSVVLQQYRGGATIARAFNLLSTRLTVEALKQREVWQNHSETSTVTIDSLGSETTSARAASSEGEDRRPSAFLGNLQLNYADTYALDVAYRSENFRYFSTKRSPTAFIRANGAWVLNHVSWLPFSSLELLKLRAGVGTSETPVIVAPAYEPFIATEREIGLDIAANARARASITYSNTHSSSPLRPPAPAVPGYPQLPTIPTGIASSTTEATLDIRALDRANGFRWDIRAVADHRSATFRSFSRSCYTEQGMYFCEGAEPFAIWGSSHVRNKSDLPARHATSGSVFDVNDEGFVVPVGAGNSWRDGKAKNLWGTSVVVDGVSYPWGIPMLRRDAQNQTTFSEIGNSNPALRYGLQNTIRVKSLRLYVLLNGQIGGEVYDALTAQRYASGNHPDVDQSAKADELRKPIGYYQQDASLYVDSFVKDATHMRLSEASVGVTLDASRMSWMRRIGARRLDIDLVGRNLFTLTNYDGANPQAPSPTSAIDGIRYPLTRTFTLATSIVF
ncbi:MAG: TonB-dependent receptor plug domain-containing protein [Gemmatimonas sp.]